MSEGLDAGMLRREAANRLRVVLQALDAEQRELLALRFAARLSSAEIAALLGAREGTIKKRLTRLISRVREQYRD
jgi:RNA polymerase sigma factor (sigma-70 family)